MKLQRTNIELDLDKLKKARHITGLKSAKEVVDFALERLAFSSKALEALFRYSGSIHFHKGYSYKRGR